jgi:hypothetical protein
MKKIVAMLLALIMVLAMSTAALAADNSNLTTVTDLPLAADYTMDIEKAYVNNDTANSTAAEPHPADVETFFVGDGTKKTDGNAATKAPELYVNGTKVDNATIPAITIVSFDEVKEDAAIPVLKVKLAKDTNFEVPGEYVYYIYETVGDNEKTAGVTYNYLENPLILKITVINKTQTTTVDGVETTVMVKDPTTGKQILQIGGVALRLDNLNLKNANNSKQKLDAGDGNKDNVHNEYEFGKVTVNKTVTGNMGDTTKPWVFKATFTPADGETVRGTIRTSGSGTYYGKTSPEINEGNGVVTGTEAAANIAAGWTDEQVVYFTITHGQSFVFDNIPEGVTYKIEEVEANKYDYTTTSTGTLTKAIAAKDDLTADFTNDKTQTPDTGVSITVVPYVMILAVAMAGAAMMIARRRREEM